MNYVRVHDWWEGYEWWIDDEMNKMWILNWWYVEWDMHDELKMDCIIHGLLDTLVCFYVQDYAEGWMLMMNKISFY